MRKGQVSLSVSLIWKARNHLQGGLFQMKQPEALPLVFLHPESSMTAQIE
jgi:hypothetical protein